LAAAGGVVVLLGCCTAGGTAGATGWAGPVAATVFELIDLTGSVTGACIMSSNRRLGTQAILLEPCTVDKGYADVETLQEGRLCCATMRERTHVSMPTLCCYRVYLNTPLGASIFIISTLHQCLVQEAHGCVLTLPLAGGSAACERLYPL
jgi:hypothetical protein